MRFFHCGDPSEIVHKLRGILPSFSVGYHTSQVVDFLKHHVQVRAWVHSKT